MSGGAADPRPIALVCMPFAPVVRPAIGLSILKACLSSSPHAVRVHYPNIRFAELIGLDLYDHISALAFATDTVFSHLAFPGQPTLAAERLRELARPYAEGLPAELSLRLARSFLSNPHGAARRPGCERVVARCEETLVAHESGQASAAQLVLELLVAVKQLAAGFVDTTVRRILEDDPCMVGASSSLGQHTASLALLAGIKRSAPSVVTVMGGATCDGSMGFGTVRHAPQLDFLVSGEAEEVLPQLVVLADRHGAGVPPELLPYGVITRALQVPAPARDRYRATLKDLDRSPIPDHGDFFCSLGASPLSPFVRPSLLAEGSRGCWWGQRRPCSFCGLNGSAGVGYRTKSPQRLLEELRVQRARHWVSRVEMVDNIIARSAFQTLIPELAQENPRFSLFMEVPGSLQEAELEALARAGVDRLQPGLESLSPGLLRLMSKCTTVPLNLQLLRLCGELGIDVVWALLKNVPGDHDAHYREMLEVLPLVSHLQPPVIFQDIEYSRHGAYCRDPGRWRLDLEPSPKYAGIYPPEAIAELAHTFEDRARRPPGPGLLALERSVRRWMDLWKGREDLPSLREHRQGDERWVVDTRPQRRVAVHRLSEVEGLVLDLARRPIRAQVLHRKVGGRFGSADVAAALDALQGLGFVITMEGWSTSLVLAGQRPRLDAARSPCGGTESPFGGFSAA